MEPIPARHPGLFGDTIDSIAKWWRKRAAIRESQSRLNSLGPDELARIASDVGLPLSELHMLTSYSADAAELLEQRLESLGLSTTDLAHRAVEQLRDMERLCTTCKSKGRCARDLASGSSDAAWQQYCPNHEALTELQAARRPAPSVAPVGEHTRAD